MIDIKWYWRRLLAMDASEVADRCFASIDARKGALRDRFSRDHGLAPVLAKPHDSRPWLLHWPEGLDAAPYLHQAKAIASGKLFLFSNDFQVGSPPSWNKDPHSGIDLGKGYGPLMALRDRERVGSIKHLWEMNRHTCLVRLVQAWRVSGDRNFLDTFARWLQAWMEQCPAHRGANWHGRHEAAMRLVNWCLCWHLLALNDTSSDTREALGSALISRWEASAATHVRFIQSHLSTGSSANNHLFGELAGIFLASVTWNGWQDSPEWCARAAQGLEEQTMLQILADGSGAEQAPSYLFEICDLLQFSILLGQRNGVAFSQACHARLADGIRFLRTLIEIHGFPPCIGDSDDAVPIPLNSPNDVDHWRALIEVSERIDGTPASCDPADKQFWLLGSAPKAAITSSKETPHGAATGEKILAQGGYLFSGRLIPADDAAIASGDVSPTSISLAMDVGSLGYLSIAAHGHADALSISLAIDGQPVLVDPGTYSYWPDDTWRDWFRGTSAHNTVCIDGEDQSRNTGPFMWSDHARVLLVSAEQSFKGVLWKALHRGYERLEDPVTHHRSLEWQDDQQCLTVIDRFTCKRHHRAAWTWQFDPQWDVFAANGHATARLGHYLLEVVLPAGSQGAVLRGEPHERGGWISTRLFHKVAASRLEARCDFEGSIAFSTVFRVSRIQT